MGGCLRHLVWIARDAGVWISEGMGGIASVFDCRQKPDLKAYDHLIIGTAIHGGKGPKDLEDLIQASIADIKNKIRAYYVVCGSGGDRPGPQAQARYIDDYLDKVCQTPAPANRAFPGRITKSLLSEEDAKVLERFTDYDHLARWECMEFGRQVLAARSAPPKKQ
jgi:hypothetical protein